MDVLVDIAIAFLDPVLELFGLRAEKSTCERKRQIRGLAILFAVCVAAAYIGVRWFR